MERGYYNTYSHENKITFFFILRGMKILFVILNLKKKTTLTFANERGRGSGANSRFCSMQF